MVKGERFQAALDQIAAQAETPDTGANSTRATLSSIANNANLSNPDSAMAAIKEASRFMVRSRLSDKYKDSKEGESAVEGLTEFISGEPSISGKFLSILKKLKEY
jgi:hypothetical protein